MKFIKELLKDLADQAWTFLGMIAMWFVLEGSARDAIGTMIVITFLVWLATFRIRNPKE